MNFRLDEELQWKAAFQLVEARMPDEDDVSSDPQLFENAVAALLARSRLAAAICGDKSALRSQPEYYEKFYSFARQKSDLAVVRIFGDWVSAAAASSVRKAHNVEPNVLGLWVKSNASHARPGVVLMRAGAYKGRRFSGLGVVLFRGALVTTALLHWAVKDGFRWTATSDQLVTTALLDAWSRLAAESDEFKRGNHATQRRLTAFCLRFGMTAPGPPFMDGERRSYRRTAR